MGQKNFFQEVIVSNEKPLIIFDDVNKMMGYLMGDAIHVTPDKVNFMIKMGKGLVYVCITEEKARQLALLPMTGSGSTDLNKDFTVSVDFKTTTTGISAYERADTIKAFAESMTESVDFRRPGHIFPLVGKPGGLIERQGIVEGVLELSKLISGQPIGYMCEILNQNGEVATLQEVEQLSDLHDLPIVFLSEIIRKKYEEHMWLHLVNHTERMISNQPIHIYHFQNRLFSSEFTVFIRPDQAGGSKQIYYEACQWGDLLGLSNSCSCKNHFRDYFQTLVKGNCHCLVYHRLLTKMEVEPFKLTIIKQQMQKLIRDIMGKRYLEMTLTPNVI